jgi:methionine-rich copper-binding protein CopC
LSSRESIDEALRLSVGRETWQAHVAVRNWTSFAKLNVHHIVGFAAVGEEAAMYAGRRILLAFLFFVAAASLLLGASAFAHAVLLESSPALKSSIPGPDVPLGLHFNVRIDAARTCLILVDPDGSLQTLEISGQDPPTISAKARGLRPGVYRLRWQVLASDGHITRGEISFTVVKP